jgi:hypothetical protein
MSDRKSSDIMLQIDSVVSNDWSSPRARLYIAATIEESNRRAEKAEVALGMEQAVNKRVLELLKETFVERLAQCEISK